MPGYTLCMERSRFAGRSTSLSCAVHTVVLLAVAGNWGRMHAVGVAPRLPGDLNGTQVTLEYRPGGAPPAVANALHAPKQLPLPAPALQAKTVPLLAPSTANTAAPGTGLTGESSLGDGNISIALVRTHPRPAPDLSGLPHGTAGDVVVDVVIDEQGRIAQATLERGLGGAIDQMVIATVQREWTFAPATKNGVAIASEQELLFHYERG